MKKMLAGIVGLFVVIASNAQVYQPTPESERYYSSVAKSNGMIPSFGNGQIYHDINDTFFEALAIYVSNNNDDLLTKDIHGVYRYGKYQLSDEQINTVNRFYGSDFTALEAYSSSYSKILANKYFVYMISEFNRRNKLRYPKSKPTKMCFVQMVIAHVGGWDELDRKMDPSNNVMGTKIHVHTNFILIHNRVSRQNAIKNPNQSVLQRNITF